MVNKWLKKVKNLSGPQTIPTQLELKIRREPQLDRNWQYGGRSFYFFDFDDNVAHLSTPLIIFHKETGQELRLSSQEFARVHSEIGKTGPYVDYRIDYNDDVGTFRCFRDRRLGWQDLLKRRRQSFVEDVELALRLPDFEWQGPSWNCFYHATFNKRPLSVITARGHSAETIKEGIRLFVKKGFLPYEPNYLCVFPVSNPVVRREQLLDPDLRLMVPELKKKAIRLSVEEAIRIYGYNSYHRFGMSDDDPRNIELIIEEMTELKKHYPEMSFFAFETQSSNYVKRQIFEGHTEPKVMTKEEQLTFNL